jgi:hypothetical protein
VTQNASITYVGDRPFFMVSLPELGRLTFNRHNKFSKVLSQKDCETLQRQWKWFTISPLVGPANIGPLPEEAPVEVAPVKKPVAKKRTAVAPQPGSRSYAAIEKKAKQRAIRGERASKAIIATAIDQVDLVQVAAEMIRKAGVKTKRTKK